MAKVYHVKDEKLGGQVEAPGGGRVKTPAYPEFTLSFPEDYEIAAHTFTNDLKKIYALTNSHGGPWVLNHGHLVALPGPRRSTSVGDVIVTRDGVFEVAPAGFRNLHLEAPAVPEDTRQHIEKVLCERIG
jgi:hypothetical protein